MYTDSVTFVSVPASGDSEGTPNDEPAPGPVAKKLKTAMNKHLEDYTIDWDMFDPKILEKMQHPDKDPSRLADLVRRAVVEVIDAIQLLNNNKKVPLQNLVGPAQQMALEYLKLFQDEKENGKFLGLGHSKILEKLKNRNMNVDRIRRHDSLNARSSQPGKTLKLREILEIGCSDWQPKQHPPGETVQSLEKKKLL